MAIDNIYTLLPRYVKAPAESTPENTEWLPLLDTDFELNHQKFTLTIFPVRIQDRIGKWRATYAGPLEEQIEDALRSLAVPANINFDASHHTLVFTNYQLLYQLNRTSSRNFSIYDVETGLKVLDKTSYQLRRDNGEFDFRPFARMSSVQQKEEKIYSIEFIPFFFSRTSMFNFTFPDFIKGRPH